MKINEAVELIEKPCYESMEKSQKRWNSIAKPLNSLGKLEGIIIKSAGFLQEESIDFGKKCVVVMCADNGVVEEGITQVSNHITAIVTENIACGKATIAVLASKMNAEVFPIDIGIAKDINNDKVIDKKIMYGTKNFAKEPAMSREEAIMAIEVGIDFVKKLKDEGYKLIATGEMGIGNTTTSSAIISCLLNKKASEVTGRGAGLSDKALSRKIQVIDNAIDLHIPDRNDPIDVLSKVGGLDIGGLVGIFLGGAAYKVPILIDGLISSVAALLAIRICPDAKEFMFATHISNEPAGKMVLKEIGVPHLLDLNMCLGEGTGAVMAFPIFDLALEVYRKMSSFDEAEIETYVEQV